MSESGNKIVRVRFAPAPSGSLHVGNARAVYINWLFARGNAGKLVLRIEDTDAGRSSEQSLDSIIGDLKWLGIVPDEGEGFGGDYGPYRQSERFDIYKKHLDVLMEKGMAYPCFCTSEMLDSDRAEQQAAGKPPRYSKRCRDISPDERKRRIAAGEPHTIRYRCGRHLVSFRDLIRGQLQFDERTLDDFIIVRTDGVPLYNFACAVDDMLMDITHVIRGDDGVSNTPKQIMLIEALGSHPPRYGHLPLMTAPGGAKLSKRTGDFSIARLKNEGYLPQAVGNYLMSIGWSSPDGREFIPADEAPKIYDIHRSSRNPANFDIDKLLWFNARYIHEMNDEEYIKEASRFFPLSDAGEWAEIKRKALLSLKKNIETLTDVAAYLPIFAPGVPPMNDEAKAALSSPDAGKVLAALKGSIEQAAKDGIIEHEAFSKLMKEIKKSTGVGGKGLYMPVRAALTGMTAGPELHDIIGLIQTATIRRRIDAALEVTKNA